MKFLIIYMYIINMEQDIINFLKPKRGKYKTLEEIDMFLNITLGVKNKYYWDLDGRFRKYYTDKIYNEYLNNVIFVYFLDSNVRLDMSARKINLLPPIKVILEGKFKEKSFTIKYFNKVLKEVMVGPKIIITSLPIDSIMLDNTTLLEELSSNTI